MKSFSVSLHGNLIMDNHYYVDQFALNDSSKCIKSYSSPGAIANLVVGLSEVSHKIKINIDSAIGDDENGRYLKRWFSNFNKLNPCMIKDASLKLSEEKTSTATIISEVINKRRSSIVEWGACSQINKLEDFKSDWAHILYIDKLEKINVESIKSLSNSSIISVDLCSSNFDDITRERIISLLPYVDFVFSSKEEAMHLSEKDTYLEAAKYLGNLCKGYSVIHSPFNCVFYNRTNKHVMSVPVEKIIQSPASVNGAGDTFTASFICAYLSGKEVGESIMNAHKNTFKILSKRIENEKV